jgi:hypothetical protein
MFMDHPDAEGRREFRPPLCVQCRGPMTVFQGEPDFKKPAFMVVTYQCAECGLRDRGCSIRHGNSTSFYDGGGRYIGSVINTSPRR